MDLSFEGGTAEQVAAVNAAIERSLFAWGELDATVTVAFVHEPDLPGHNEFAYTVVGPGTGEVQFRDTLGLGDPDNFYGSRGIVNDMTFLTETAHHEFGHVAVGQVDNTIATFAPLMTHTSGRQGSAEEWAPDDAAWEDYVLEGVVETFKDVFLPKPWRRFDNRTHWRLTRARFEAFVTPFLGLVDRGGLEVIRISSTLTAHLPPFYYDAEPGVNVTSAFGGSTLPEGVPLRFRWGKQGDGHDPNRGLLELGSFQTTHEGWVLGAIVDQLFPDVGGGSVVSVAVQVYEWDNIDPASKAILDQRIVPVIDDGTGFWMQVSYFVAAITSALPPWPYSTPTTLVGVAGAGRRPSRSRIVSRYGRIEAPIDVRTARRAAAN